ncbi:unnamed protein product [Cuscuta campestris]|uniref:Uncharacterized protein n=1 Tax=Cuscuta campestris TaxID=132261 RepID=A0A484N8H5_9ASTE|nr:unnamed protein product [Cuscuta campestris]
MALANLQALTGEGNIFVIVSVQTACESELQGSSYDNLISFTARSSRRRRDSRAAVARLPQPRRLIADGLQRRHAEHRTSPLLPASFLAVERSAAVAKRRTPLFRPRRNREPLSAELPAGRRVSSRRRPLHSGHPPPSSAAPPSIAAPPVAARRRRAAAPPLSPASVTVAAFGRCPELISPAD